jgi:hypothetical protein
VKAAGASRHTLLVRMRHLLTALVIVVAGCGSDAATNLLCGSCNTDADCGGNPCFTDVSGKHFCGAPCEAGCPSAFTCSPVHSTSKGVVNTCFPKSMSCNGLGPSGNKGDMGAGGNGGSGGGGGDAGGGGPNDMALIPCTPPAGGTLTTSGGTVDRLFFGYTGDTRMASSGSGYPSDLQTVINTIFTEMGQKGVEFALDGGDHMEASNATEAADCMSDYLTAAKLLNKPLFMTMGNHECSNSYNMGSDCSTDKAPWSDFKLHAFMQALQTQSAQTMPYYRVDIMTGAGKAAFIVVADDVWTNTAGDTSTEGGWLEQQLEDTDKNAKFVFVSKHHPYNEPTPDQTFFADIDATVLKHKYTMLLTGHSHEYKHEKGSPRIVVVGTGGAPHDNPSQPWWGYMTVMQCPNNGFNVIVYDQMSGNEMDQFSLPPQ